MCANVKTFGAYKYEWETRWKLTNFWAVVFNIVLCCLVSCVSKDADEKQREEYVDCVGYILACEVIIAVGIGFGIVVAVGVSYILYYWMEILAFIVVTIVVGLLICKCNGGASKNCANCLASYADCCDRLAKTEGDKTANRLDEDSIDNPVAVPARPIQDDR